MKNIKRILILIFITTNLFTNTISAQNLTEWGCDVLNNGCEKIFINNDFNGGPNPFIRIMNNGNTWTMVNNTSNTSLGDPGFIIARTATNDWLTLGSDYFHISNNGNIGLGINNPSQKLDVNGNANINGNIYLSNSSGNKSIYTWNPGDSNWRIGMNANPGFNRAIATAHVQYLTYSGSDNQGFAVGVNGGDSSFEITGNHKAFFRGNVGIGTASPSEKLQVMGHVNFSNIPGTTTARLNFISPTNLNTFTIGCHDDNTAEGAGFLFLNAAKPLTFGTSAIERFRITASGNVGIGTTTPSSKLQVTNGAIRPFEGNSDSSGISFSPNIGGGTLDEAYIRYYVESGENTKMVIGTGNDADDDIAFNQAGAERMTIYNGNVGIGTSTPSEKLAVVGTGRFTAGLKLDTTGVLEFGVGNTKEGNAGKICYGCFDSGASLNIVGAGTTNTNRKIKIWNEGGLETNGSIGIGKPVMSDVRLAVNGSFNVSNSSNTTIFHVSSGKNKVFIGSDAYAKFQAASASGTITTSDYSLWVSQGVNATDFAMSDITSWSDYVFAKEYKLPTLKETEAYIIANKHLPNIPSEADVKKNGYSVKDMTNNFLKTIEEMTLHSIEQEKKINEQETQLKTLTNELQEIKELLLKKQ